jgi:hypothetical protein
MSSARKSLQKIQILNKMINMHESSFKTRKLQPICLLLLMMATLIIAVPFVPQSNAQATQTLYYDNGEIFGYTSGYIYGVKFSLPAGVSSANILTVRYMWYAVGGTLVIHIAGPDHIEELTDPISATAAVGMEGPGVWNEVDVSDKSIVVSGDFYVAVEKTGEETTGIIMDNSTDGVRSFWGPSMASLINPSPSNYMIRVVIQPITPTPSPTPSPTSTPTPPPTSTPSIPEFPQTAVLLVLMIILLGMATLITQQRHKKNQYLKR